MSCGVKTPGSWPQTEHRHLGGFNKSSSSQQRNQIGNQKPQQNSIIIRCGKCSKSCSLTTCNEYRLQCRQKCCVLCIALPLVTSTTARTASNLDPGAAPVKRVKQSCLPIFPSPRYANRLRASAWVAPGLANAHPRAAVAAVGLPGAGPHCKLRDRPSPLWQKRKISRANNSPPSAI